MREREHLLRGDAQSLGGAAERLRLAVQPRRNRIVPAARKKSRCRRYS